MFWTVYVHIADHWRYVGKKVHYNQQGNWGDMRKSAWRGSFSKLMVPRVILLKKQKESGFRYAKSAMDWRVCVPNFRSRSILVWSEGRWQTDNHTDLRANIRIPRASRGFDFFQNIPNLLFEIWVHCNIISYSSTENIFLNKAIEEICGKSTWHGSFSRLAAVTVIWSKKEKTRF